MTESPYPIREWIIVWAYRVSLPQSAQRNPLKISVNSAFAVVRKYVAHSFRHSLLSNLVVSDQHRLAEGVPSPHAANQRIPWPEVWLLRKGS